MGRAEIQVGQFSDSEETRIQAAKHSSAGSAYTKRLHISDAQELRFHTANRSNMGNAPLQAGVLATSQESHFQAAKSFRYEQCHPERWSIS